MRKHGFMVVVAFSGNETRYYNGKPFSHVFTTNAKLNAKFYKTALGAKKAIDRLPNHIKLISYVKYWEGI